MSTIPVFLKIDPARPCLVVGGGAVALRKAAWLLACGASVQVLSPEFDPGMDRFVRERPGRLALRREPYTSRDLAGYQLAIAATGDLEVNRLVAADARHAAIPANVVDAPELCTFYVPATVQRGDLQLAIGTAGVCPSLAARLRRELELTYPEWYQTFTAALGRVRRQLTRTITDPHRRCALLDHLASGETAESLKTLDLEAMTVALERAARYWLSR